MRTKSGGKLRPAITRKKQQTKEPQDKLVTGVLALLMRRRMLATRRASARLSRWFGHMAAGSSVDLRTPFFADQVKGKAVPRPREGILKRFDAHLESLWGTNGPLGEILREWEMEHRARVGPQSMYLPWRLDGPEKAKSVFRDKPQISKLDKAAWQRACARTQSLIRSGSVELVSPEIAIAGVGDDPEGGMDTGTNSGLPWVISPWKSSGDTGRSGDEEVLAAYQWIISRVKELVPVLSDKRTSASQLPYWGCLSGQRLVQKGDKPFSPKSKRLVIAYPKEEAILGKMATIGIMDALREVKSEDGIHVMTAWQPLWHIDSSMQRLLNVASKAGRTVLSGDISNFDATVPPWALWDVVQLVASWLRGGETFLRNLGYCMIYRTWLATPSGIYGPGPSSMKSGSSLTNLIGSMTNLTMQFYGQEIGLYEARNVCVLGDDFVLDGNGVTPEATSETFSHFEMEAHPDKQYYRPEHLQFLQRMHKRGRIGGIASVYRTLGSVLSLEKLSIRPRDWNKFAYVVQALSKLQNATFHPMFKELVNFVAMGDKLRLGSGMSVKDLVAGAGNAGERILATQARQSWKQLGSGVGFEDWTINGVLRGETLPRDSLALFRRVYGRDPI